MRYGSGGGERKITKNRNKFLDESLTLHSNKLSSFNNFTRNPSTGSSSKLLYSRAKALTADEVIIYNFFLFFFLFSHHTDKISLCPLIRVSIECFQYHECFFITKIKFSWIYFAPMIYRNNFWSLSTSSFIHSSHNFLRVSARLGAFFC